MNFCRHTIIAAILRSLTMRSGLYLLLMVPFSLSAIAQKRTVGIDTYAEWPSLPKLEDYGITDNGKYIWYRSAGRLHIVSPAGKALFSDSSDINPLFADEATMLWLHNGVLTAIDLTNRSEKKYFINDIAEVHQLFSADRFLVFNRGRTAFTLQARTGKMTQLQNQTDGYKLNEKKSAVILQKGTQLVWADLIHNKTRVITDIPGINIYSVTFDNAGNRILFSASEPKEIEATSRQPTLNWYYFHEGLAQAMRLMQDNAVAGYIMSEAVPLFNRDGKQVIITLTAAEKKETKPAYRGFWHYQGKRFVDDIKQSVIVSLAIDEVRPKPKFIAKGRLEILGPPGSRYVLIKRNFLVYDDLYWNSDMRPKFILADLATGTTRDVIGPEVAPVAPRFPILSPREKYIVWFDYASTDYLAYDISKAQLKNMTAALPVPADVKQAREGSTPSKFVGIEAWVGNDEYVILREKYDLWQIDPLQLQRPVNLTGGYGRKNEIQFVPAEFINSGERLPNGSHLMVRAMEDKTKNNGFFRIKLGQKNQLAHGHLHACLFSWNMIDEPKRILKVKNADVFLVTRQTAEQALNLAVTNDLKSFKQLTSFAPQKKYNWMKSELVNYPLRSGNSGQAILFKPENFDPSKRYPVIFNYYESRTDELHRFRDPHIFENNIDVASYVSNGYLVCMPDINNIVPGRVKETVLDAVESAVDHLARYRWFDTTKMGLQGQSFGGYETNLIIANSKRFAAACSMAGIADVRQYALSFAFGRSNYWMLEQGIFNLGKNSWEDPQLYVTNDPVSKADQIITPLLLLHNRDDGAVPFAQAETMFFALRRLRKPVWLFEYEGGHTSPGSDESNTDFTIRLQQFFDHYLKGAPQADWMKNIEPDEL